MHSKKFVKYKQEIQMLVFTLHGVLVTQGVQFADVGGKSQKYRTSP